MDALAREQQNNTDNIPATDAERTKRESSAGLRRGSMSDGHSGDALNLVQDTVAGEAERRDMESSVADTIPETAIESATPTPLVEVNKQLQTSTPLPPKIPTQKEDKEDKEAENPDKPVTGAEEEPGAMKPADPTSAKAVSGGKALPPVGEDLRKTTSNEKKGAAAKTNGSRISSVKPAAISTKSTSKPASSVKSPGSTAKSPLSPPAHHGLTKKSSRTSLTAPTAASVARAAAADKSAGSNSAPAKPKPREVTKPLEVSSRLTAPTAASRARLESATAAESKPKPVAASRPKPSTASARPTPRTSLARPESRSSQSNTRKNAGPVDGSFLERMTRPTAASSNKAHEKTEKVEVKGPPRSKQLPMRQKTNGHPRGPKSTEFAASTTTDETTGAGAVDESVLEDESIMLENDLPSSEPKTGMQPLTDGAKKPDAAETATKGNETPNAQTNGHKEDAATLEDTPAALSSADPIR